MPMIMDTDPFGNPYNNGYIEHTGNVHHTGYTGPYVRAHNNGYICTYCDVQKMAV
jgi:hypothetical protein